MLLSRASPAPRFRDSSTQKNLAKPGLQPRIQTRIGLANMARRRGPRHAIPGPPRLHNVVVPPHNEHDVPLRNGASSPGFGRKRVVALRGVADLVMLSGLLGPASVVFR